MSVYGEQSTGRFMIAIKLKIYYINRYVPHEKKLLNRQTSRQDIKKIGTNYFFYLNSNHDTLQGVLSESFLVHTPARTNSSSQIILILFPQTCDLSR